MWYVKKPIPVEAIQFTGDNRAEILDFTKGKAIFKDENGTTVLIIHTLEGDMIARKGCYIACGPRDDYYPIQEDIFEATYESLERKK